MNAECYKDPTAEQAIHNAMRAPSDVMQVINMMKAIAGVAGFDVVERIHLRDRTTGKEWK